VVALESIGFLTYFPAAAADDLMGKNLLRKGDSVWRQWWRGELVVVTSEW
jgi:hypothetical protein